MNRYTAGQRWVSETEPELGLGTVVQVEEERVQMLFPASGELRTYATRQAPLKRVLFRVGDSILTHDGQTLVVESVRENGDLLTYYGQGRECPEALLSDMIGFQTARNRLMNGHIDDSADFLLRARTMVNRHRRRKSDIRGFIGGRIDLIPHQLYIVHEVSARQAPRVLLSDEVGLGKTIEACLILHRMLLTGRAARILIVVPDSLVHQWFVELLRRFNLWFHIFDEARCAAIEAGAPDNNPFLDDQLVLCTLSFLVSSERRARQALAAGWDLLVVDEAHHLAWSPALSSPEYTLVEALSRRTDGLLLLTATPEQLGPESHFARLRLLDPDRYPDLEAFLEEPAHFEEAADLIDKLEAGQALSTRERRLLTEQFAHEPGRIDERLAAVARHNEAARRELIDDLLDLHGPGRVIFRNTRAAMSGFPERRVHLAPLEAPNPKRIAALTKEFAADAGNAATQPAFDFTHDSRLDWLVALLQELDSLKVLLICRSKEKALALHEILRQRINLKSAVFHEGLTLVQRDRNAAWFAEEDGARLLICSEIGSEGRNFQFAHHLVLFDLPLNPELLEQRIGRLDRIGQTETVHIHIPYLEGSPHEVLARWYHEGLDAFEKSLEGGNELLRQFGESVFDLARAFPDLDPREAEASLAALIRETKQARIELQDRLEKGRDRLLEMNSYRPEAAQRLVDAIRAADRDPALPAYLMDVFEHFDVLCDELSAGIYRLRTQPSTSATFSSIPGDGVCITFDRTRALSREDVAFVSWDHPLVTEAMDLVLESERGNSSFAIWPDGQHQAHLLEARFVLETVAEKRLHVDRFLPATPIRILFDQNLEDLTHRFPHDALLKRLRSGTPQALLEQTALVQHHLPAMIDAATGRAEARAESIVEQSLTAMHRLLDHEISRLQMLQQVNRHIRPEEIERTMRERKDLEAAIRQARVRLDALRLIWRGADGKV